MIFDSLQNAHLYSGLEEGINKALQYLKVTDFSDMKPGRYDIEGDAVFALVSSYDTKPLEDCFWEAHRKHIDVQYMVSGSEKMGISYLDRMTVKEDYNNEKDYLVLEGAGDLITVHAGSFVVFRPTDVHMPQVAVTNPSPVLKVVIKVRV